MEVLNHPVKLQASQIHKKAIEQFWSRFGGWKSGGCYSGFLTSEKLLALIEISNLKIEYRKQQPAEKRRAVFDKVKQSLCRNKIGSPCFSCGVPGYARHHIIQIQNGGINSRKNLIVLCDECHSKIHPWM